MTAKLDRLLRERRVCYRRRSERSELVERLTQAGRPPTGEDLDELAELAEKAEERRTVSETHELVERWLVDGSWRRRLRDERKARARHEQEAAAMNMPEHEVVGRLVCRVLGDRARIAAVAEELYLDVDEARDLLETWAPRYGHPETNVEAALRR